MPSYAHLFSGDGQRGRDLVAYLASLGEPDSAEHWELTAQGWSDPPAPPSAARGAALFATYCAVCHGREGRGDGRYAEQISDAYMNLRKPGFHSVPPGAPENQALARIIRHGLPPTTMPGHEWLTGQQVADLVAHVQTLPSRQEAAR
jgi:cytochrome c